MKIHKKRIPTIPRPFVKWAGSKARMIPHLKKYIPKKFERYFEPFLGGGAVFFYLSKIQSQTFAAFLSDLNEELVNSYLVVRNHLPELLQLLINHQENYTHSPEPYFYNVRNQEIPPNTIERAARTIFLNKTCYNGLYRVNKQGKFNVPFGTYKNPKICDTPNLTAVSSLLNNRSVKLEVSDYRDSLKQAVELDFIYLDPPYLPVTKTQNFTSYTTDGFSPVDQESLAEEFKALIDKGCHVVLSNSDTPKIRDLYSGFKLETIEVSRMISCKGSGRRGFTELIIAS
ncbi:MAG: DNA adenine methylase [Candidatus Ranarchaeia archaeon]|jgi:DNA adenine methylase